LVHALMRETEALRGLRFLASVEVRIEDRRAMRAYVERALDDEQLERARLRYLALGAIDPQLDVRGLLVSVMEEELVGYYDPEQKRLAVRDDIARALDAKATGTAPPERGLAWRATVVHELVHALQDQHFDLGASIERKRSTDADNAFGALIEGDATLVMLAYTAQLSGESLRSLTDHPERVLSAMSRTPEQLTGALRRAPALLREPLLFRYREGAHFCAELFRAGGWESVDAAHRAPPLTTLSVRNPRRYLGGVAEPALTLPELDWLPSRGYHQLDDDVLGGLELSVVLGTAGIEAEYIVSAWRGDRYVVLERAGARSSIWWLRMATTATARNVAAAFAQLGDPARKIARRGNTLIVARGVDADTFAALVSTPAAFEQRPREVFKRSARGPNRGDPLATNGHEH
jgi:hypothetical protein